MIKFDLDDLMFAGLRKLGDYYNIPKTITTRDPLLVALRERMPADSEVVFGQSAKPWYKTPTFWISFAGVLISGIGIVIATLAMRATWLNATTAATNLEQTIQRESKQQLDSRIEDWQRVVVYAQLQDGSKAVEGLTFDQIKAGYVQHAFTSEDIDLKKAHLQDHVLRKILIDLMSFGIIYQTTNDRYVVARTLLLRGLERVGLENRAKYMVLHILSSEAGKHTVPELGQIVVGKLMITVEEYNLIINELIAANGVLIDEKKKVWSAANPPPRKP